MHLNNSLKSPLILVIALIFSLYTPPITTQNQMTLSPSTRLKQTIELDVSNLVENKLFPQEAITALKEQAERAFHKIRDNLSEQMTGFELINNESTFSNAVLLAAIQHLAFQQNHHTHLLIGPKEENLNNWYHELLKQRLDINLSDEIKPQQIAFFGNDFDAEEGFVHGGASVKKTKAWLDATLSSYQENQQKKALFFYVDESLLLSSDKQYNLNDSPAFQSLLTLLKAGFPVALSTTNDYHMAFRRLIRPIPPELRKNLVFYANGLASKYLFDQDLDGKEDLSYREGKELTESEIRELAHAFKTASDNYKYRQNDDDFSEPFPTWLKKGEETDAHLRPPEFQKRGQHQDRATQVSIKYIASRLAANNFYPERGKGPDAREIFHADILNNISPELKEALDIRIEGFVTIDITRKGINKKTALEDFLSHINAKKYLSVQDPQTEFLLLIKTADSEDSLTTQRKSPYVELNLDQNSEEQEATLKAFLELTTSIWAQAFLTTPSDNPSTKNKLDPAQTSTQISHSI